MEPSQLGLVSLLRSRRSIRKYADESIPENKILLMKEALLRSPTSRGFNHWEFVFVDDPVLLEQLSRARPHGSSFLAGAQLGIVICGDETRSDVWVEDCSIAAIIVQLQAHSVGLGSCWVQIRKRPHDDSTSAEAYVQQLLGIPSRMRVECIMGVGVPAEEKTGHPRTSLQQGKIRRNRYA